MLTLNYQEDILRHCAGRITPYDADLLFKTAMEINAQKILEIGSMDGCSTMVLGSIAKETGGKLQCIEPVPRKQWRWNIERLGLQEYVEMVFLASPWVPMSIINKPLDYLFIDGDHRTRWAIADYHYFSPFVRVGGRIGFHDWANKDKGVGKMVQEAVGIILRDDEKILKEVGQTTNTRGLIVFEKTGESYRIA